MKDIQSSRKEINQIDLQMAELFEKRMEICKDIALYKKDNGLSVRDEAREAEVVKRNAEYIQNTEIQPYYEDFIRNTMDVSCKYQSSLLRSMRVQSPGAHEGGSRLPDQLRHQYNLLQETSDNLQGSHLDRKSVV